MKAIEVLFERLCELSDRIKIEKYILAKICLTKDIGNIVDTIRGLENLKFHGKAFDDFI